LTKRNLTIENGDVVLVKESGSTSEGNSEITEDQPWNQRTIDGGKRVMSRNRSNGETNQAESVRSNSGESDMARE
jgi:hypothetical protein